MNIITMHSKAFAIAIACLLFFFSTFSVVSSQFHNDGTSLAIMTDGNPNGIPWGLSGPNYNFSYSYLNYNNFLFSKEKEEEKDKIRMCQIRSAYSHEKCTNDAHSALHTRSMITIGAGVLFGVMTTPAGGTLVGSILGAEAIYQHNKDINRCTRENRVREINCE